MYTISGYNKKYVSKKPKQIIIGMERVSELKK
jgi:hypothetical protein